MKCSGCAYESFDFLETCKHCGAPMVANTVALAGSAIDPADELLSLRFEPEHSATGHWVPGSRRRQTTPGGRVDRGGDFMERLDNDAIEVGEDDLDGARATGPGSVEDDGGLPFRIDDDLFIGYDPSGHEVPGTVPGSDGWVDLTGPVFALSGEETGTAAGGEPIVDRYDEIPERYWALEVADLGRRALALLVDQLVLLAFLGIFFFGAFVALRLNGFDTSLFLATAGLQASALPFALLAAVHSLAYYSFFHGSTGRTPGKALVGIEVRTAAGGALSWGRAIRRWLGAALGLACAGVGICWALFEPRRRGWADLISGTVVARLRREPRASE